MFEKGIASFRAGFPGLFIELGESRLASLLEGLYITYVGQFYEWRR